MPTPRVCFSTSVVNGKIYVFLRKGYGYGITISEMYDPETDTWSTRADMLIGKYYHASSVVNGKIYAISSVIEAQSDVTAIGKPIRDHEDYTR